MKTSELWDLQDPGWPFIILWVTLLIFYRSVPIPLESQLKPSETFPPWSFATSILKTEHLGKECLLVPLPQTKHLQQRSWSIRYLPFPVLDHHPRPMVWRKGEDGAWWQPRLRCQIPIVLIKVQLFLNKSFSIFVCLLSFYRPCNSSPFNRCFVKSLPCSSQQHPGGSLYTFVVSAPEIWEFLLLNLFSPSLPSFHSSKSQILKTFET